MHKVIDPHAQPKSDGRGTSHNTPNTDHYPVLDIYHGIHPIHGINQPNTTPCFSLQSLPIYRSSIHLAYRLIITGGFPVLVLHGLFQSSGSFVTSEDRSLAFWLAKQGGYQVYLGNTRGVFDMGHRSFGRNDPRFWGMSSSLLDTFSHPSLCQSSTYDSVSSCSAFGLSL